MAAESDSAAITQANHIFRLFFNVPVTADISIGKLRRKMPSTAPKLLDMIIRGVSWFKVVLSCITAKTEQDSVLVGKGRFYGVCSTGNRAVCATWSRYF